MNLGDIRVGQVLYCHFTTRQFSTGAPITSASLALSVYKDDNTTQSTSGITTTFTTGFDGVAGLVSVKIDTSSDGTFYAAGHDFSLVVTTGTADSVSIVGESVRYFSIENRSALMPTTAARKLDVSAGGKAGIDWANVGSPTTAVDLSGTNIKTDQKVDVNTIKTQTVTAGAGVTIRADIGAAAAPGAANGMLIGGSNAATTFAGLTTGALACTTVTVSGAVAFQSTFAVTTSTALGALSCTTLTASGAVALQSTLAVTGATTLAGLSTGAFSCTTLTASGAVAFQSTFAVTTSSAFGALSCSTLTASGAVAFQSTFAVTTSTALAALSCTTLTASGAVALQSTVGITGAVTLSSTLGVGATTLSALTVTNNLLVSGTATVTGATAFTGAVTATNAGNDFRGVLLQKGISAAMDELTGDPTATPTGAQALMLPFMAIRNKRDTTSSDDTICNSAGTIILTAALSDDSVTFEKGKYA